MPENMRYFGLCMSCRNASSCTFPRDPAKPSYYCEEFEIDTTSLTMSSGNEHPMAISHDAIDKKSPKFIGLCSDCEGNKNCAFPKPEGGIWRCEEYR